MPREVPVTGTVLVYKSSEVNSKIIERSRKGEEGDKVYYVINFITNYKTEKEIKAWIRDKNESNDFENTVQDELESIDSLGVYEKYGFNQIYYEDVDTNDIYVENYDDEEIKEIDYESLDDYKKTEFEVPIKKRDKPLYENDDDDDDNNIEEEDEGEGEDESESHEPPIKIKKLNENTSSTIKG